MICQRGIVVLVEGRGGEWYEGEGGKRGKKKRGKEGWDVGCRGRMGKGGLGCWFCERAGE